MASTNQTEHFALNQWEPNDSVLREDFNADNLTVDRELNTLAGQINRNTPVTGIYHGTGTSSTQEIELGFRPSILLIMPNTGYYINSTTLDFFLSVMGEENDRVKLQDTGFTVTGTLNYPVTGGPTASSNKNPYRYMAWK